LDVNTALRLAAVGLFITVVAAGVAFGTALLLPKEYAARTELLYQITIEQPTGFLRDDRNLTTQTVLLRSRTVLAPVAAPAGMSVEDLEDKVSVSVVEGSEVLVLEVRDGSRQTAAQLADAITKRYLEVAGQSGQLGVRAYLEKALADVRGQLAKTPNAAPDRAALANREQELVGQLDNLAVSQLAGPQAQVIVPTYDVADPVSPRPLYAAATGALAGLMIAIVVVAILARRWTRS
jgi:capsular polysaccharide biosynthesis protein